MPGTSSKTQTFTIRLKNRTVAEIERLLRESPRLDLDPNSVNEYCQQCVERYVWRHSTRKYRQQP